MVSIILYDFYSPPWETHGFWMIISERRAVDMVVFGLQ